MKSTEIEYKGTKYTTKEGKPLIENTLEVGDLVNPCFNRVMTQGGKEGDNKKFVEYRIKAIVKDSEGNIHKGEDGEGIFVKLTPGQAKSLQKASENEELTQNIYEVYEYENKFGKQIGIGKKGSDKKPIGFN